MSGTSALLRVRVARERGGATVVVLVGELDLATAGGLRTRLATLAQADPPPSVVVLDLAGLDFVDASGISVLLSAQRALAGRGASLVLRSPSRMVRKVLRLLDLDGVLQVERP